MNQCFQEMFSFHEFNISVATLDVGYVMKCRGTIGNKESWGRKCPYNQWWCKCTEKEQKSRIKERMEYEQYNLLRVWKLEANPDLEILKKS